MGAFHIILIGLRGSGKTTVGPALASRLGLPFIDLDDLTPRELGEPGVADAWGKHGEPAFRRAETAALRKLLATAPAVIALGGGTPTAPGAGALLLDAQGRGSARVVYLRAAAPTLQERLRASLGPHRPSLTGADPVEEIPLVLARRDHVYLRLADRTVSVDDRSIDDVVKELTGAFGA